MLKKITVDETLIEKLYCLAFLSTGDASVSERITKNACVGSAGKNRLIRQSIGSCLRLLYISGKKESTNISRGLHLTHAGPYELSQTRDNGRLCTMLQVLSFTDRFLILLFCYMKFSSSQIASILRLPAFFVRKRIVDSLHKISNLNDKRYTHLGMELKNG